MASLGKPCEKGNSKGGVTSYGEACGALRLGLLHCSPPLYPPPLVPVLSLCLLPLPLRSAAASAGAGAGAGAGAVGAADVGSSWCARHILEWRRGKGGGWRRGGGSVRRGGAK